MSVFPIVPQPDREKKKEKKSLEQRLKADFRLFLILLWGEMLLPKPTHMQLLLADTLQKNTHRLLVILGFRGFAKTYITCAYIMWRLYRNPKLKACIWASNQENAGDSTKLMLSWVRNVDWLKHLAPEADQDQAALSFDVRGRGIFRGSSVTAYGITGTITGTRGDILAIDDPETSTNGDTVKKRIAIDRAMNEASLVMTARDDDELTQVIVLGTVHFDDSLYSRLVPKGYKMYLFPICVPSQTTQKQCWDYYPEKLRELFRPKAEGGMGLQEGTPLDRFGDTEIELRRGIGALNFERQCLVNPFRTSLSQKPFDMRKIIVFQAASDMLPVRFWHTQDDRFLDQEAMNFSSASLNDKLYRPYKWDDQMRPYDRKLAWIDPAGDNKKNNAEADELSLTIVGVSGGYAVCFHSEGFVGGSKQENQDRILEVCRQNKVDLILVEDNFGMGMFASLLRATQMRKYGRFSEPGAVGMDDIIPIDTRHTTKKKGKRIVDAIDPVLNAGKLIITPTCFQGDYESANIHVSENKLHYRLSYQLSYGNESLSLLPHDDRVEGLASCLEELRGFLSIDPETEAETWDSWLIRRLFAQDAQQFQGDRGVSEEILVTGEVVERADYALTTRDTFL